MRVRRRRATQARMAMKEVVVRATRASRGGVKAAADMLTSVHRSREGMEVVDEVVMLAWLSI